MARVARPDRRRGPYRPRVATGRGTADPSREGVSEGELLLAEIARQIEEKTRWVAEQETKT